MTAGSDPAAQRQLDELVEDARIIAAVMRAVHDTVPLPALLASPSRIAARAALLEHLERIDAAVVLYPLGLLHQTLAMVRPALDSMIWLRYLTSVQPESVRDQLVTALGEAELIATLDAEQQYAGKKPMTALGFPASFVNDMRRYRRDALARLRRLAGELGSPALDDATATPIPSSAWIAQRADRPRTYARTFAATSKAVHFSASELLRRAWAEPGNPVDLHHPAYLRWRGALALTELLHLLPEIVDAAATLCPELDAHAGELPIAEHDAAAYEAAWERHRARGLVPLVHPAMFNLHKIDWAASRRTRRPRPRK